MKKLRADSRFARLEPAQRAKVDDMLMGGASYSEVAQYMHGLGIKISQTSCADYYQTHLRPLIWARRERLASCINAEESGSTTLDSTTLLAVRQRVFELAVNPSGAPKIIKQLFELILKAESIGHESRRIALLEAKAAAADAAITNLKSKIALGGLTPEALALAEE